MFSFAPTAVHSREQACVVPKQGRQLIRKSTGLEALLLSLREGREALAGSRCCGFQETVVHRYQKETTGAREMGPWVKRLPCQQEDLGLDRKHLSTQQLCLTPTTGIEDSVKISTSRGLIGQSRLKRKR